MTEKKVTTKKATAKADPAPMPTDIVEEIMVEVSTIKAPEYCDTCGTLTHLCICQWRGNEIYDCDCTMCPCMEQVSREGALCATCKTHE